MNLIIITLLNLELCGTKHQDSSTLASEVREKNLKTSMIILPICYLITPNRSQNNGDLVTYSFIKHLLRARIYTFMDQMLN